jgi:hypothetical protein
VNATEFAEWRGFRLLYPRLEERVDIAAAIVRAGLSGGKAADYLPDYTSHFEEPEELPSDDELARKLNGFFRAIQAAPPPPPAEATHG